jgi:hypothetical protein
MGATSGGPKDLPSATKRGQTRLIKAVFLAVAVVMVGVGAAMLADARYALLGGGRTPGTVVGLRSAGRLPAPTIRYRVSGQEYLCQARIGTSGYWVGQGVTIRYHPDHPGEGRLDTFRELWLFPLTLLGFGTVIVYGIASGKARIGSSAAGTGGFPTWSTRAARPAPPRPEPDP